MPLHPANARRAAAASRRAICFRPLGKSNPHASLDTRFLACRSCTKPHLHPQTQDRVANIRFNAAKVLERLAPLADTLLIDQTFKPCLQELQDDADSDVRFFARQALSACDNVTAMA